MFVLFNYTLWSHIWLFFYTRNIFLKKIYNFNNITFNLFRNFFFSTKFFEKQNFFTNNIYKINNFNFLKKEKKVAVKKRSHFFFLKKEFAFQLKLNLALLQKFLCNVDLKFSNLKKKMLTLTKKSKNLYLHFIVFTLLTSRIFFSTLDIYYCLNNNFIYFDGEVIKSKFFFLKKNYFLQLIVTATYFLYYLYFFNQLKKYKTKLLHKFWQLTNTVRASAKSNCVKHVPRQFHNYFFFYYTIPSWLEVDAFTMSFFVLQSPFYFSKDFLSFLNKKSYFWMKQ